VIGTLVKRQELGGTVEIPVVIASTKDATDLLEDSLFFKWITGAVKPIFGCAEQEFGVKIALG
jgi:hypothetical protein